MTYAVLSEHGATRHIGHYEKVKLITPLTFCDSYNFQKILQLLVFFLHASLNTEIKFLEKAQQR